MKKTRAQRRSAGREIAKRVQAGQLPGQGPLISTERGVQVLDGTSLVSVPGQLQIEFGPGLTLRFDFPEDGEPSIRFRDDKAHFSLPVKGLGFLFEASMNLGVAEDEVGTFVISLRVRRMQLGEETRAEVRYNGYFKADEALATAALDAFGKAEVLDQARDIVYNLERTAPPTEKSVQEASLAALEERLEALQHRLEAMGTPSPKSTPKSNVPAIVATKRSEELQYLKDNYQEIESLYGGSYVVIEGRGIIASGPESAEPVAAARQQGIQRPFVIYIAPPPSPGEARPLTL